MAHRKSVIITGSTSGIGLETAKEIAREGCNVIMACRDTEKGERQAERIRDLAHNPHIKVMPLDLSSIESIQSFVEIFQKTEDRLDVLINNAGVFCDTFLKTVHGFEMTMGVNYLGTVLLTELLLPSLKKTPYSRIVHVSSRASLYAKLHVQPEIFTSKTAGFKAYSRSKLALNLYTIDLATRLTSSGVTVNGVFPGRVATNIWNGKSLLMKIVRPIMMRISISAREGAQTVIYLALSQDVEGITGKVFEKREVVLYKKTFLHNNIREDLMALTYDILNCKKYDD